MTNYPDTVFYHRLKKDQRGWSLDLNCKYYFNQYEFYIFFVVFLNKIVIKLIFFKYFFKKRGFFLDMSYIKNRYINNIKNR